MNLPTQFARHLLGPCAIGRRAATSSCSSATFNHDQTLTHGSGRGVPTEPGKLGFRASMPVRGTFVRGQATAGHSRQGILSTGRPFGVGIFSRAEGRSVNCVLAKPNICPLSDERLKNFAKRAERHLSKSSASSTYASKIAQKRGQDRGFFSQGRGNVTRGRGADD